MSRYLCCCLHKKVKNKQIKALKPQYGHLAVSPNDYVMENLCIVKVKQNNQTDQYYGKILKKRYNTDDSDSSSSDILVKQQPCIVSKRQIKSYPSSPKQEDNDLIYFSDPVLEYGQRNRQLFDKKTNQQVYSTKVDNSKSVFRKQQKDKRRYTNSIEYEKKHEEPFPFKISVGERKFTSLLYDNPPEEILEKVQKKIQERRCSQMNESPETSLFCDFVTDSSDIQYSSHKDVTKSHWKSERSTPYYIHSSETSDNEDIKVQSETISEQKINQEMSFEKQLKKNEEPFATRHQINNIPFPEKLEKLSSSTSLINQQPDERTVTSQEPVTTTENNEAPFKMEKHPLIYSVSTPRTRPRSKSIVSRPRSKSIVSSTIDALANQNPQTFSSKAIRRTRDIDVFVSQKQDQPRDEPEPQYINVGRGPRIRGTPNELLVANYLNQFSSVFVDNLKEPIPKDPLSRPRIYNVYVPPRPRVTPRNIQRPPPKRKSSIASRPRKGLQYIPKREQDITSSDEDVIQPRKSVPVMSRRSITRSRKSTPGVRRNMNIYSAQIKEKNPYRKVDEYKKLETNDVDDMNWASDEDEESNDETLHGLRCVGPNKETNSNLNNHATTTLNTSQETINNDVEDGETDLFCYPTNKFLNDTLLEASTSGSNKLRWKIIIKRGNENL